MAEKRYDVEQALQHFTSTDDAKALHDLRVALRRLQTLLRIIDHDSLTPLRALFKRTNQARDMEVFIQILGQLNLSSTELEQHWRQQLVEALRELRLTLGSSWEAIAHCLPDKFETEETLRQLATKRLIHEIRRMQKRRTQLCRHWDAHTAHKLRISGKHLRYLLEPFTDKDNSVEACVDALKSFQDLLGEYHDYDVMVFRLKNESVAVSTIDTLIQRMRGLHDNFIARYGDKSNNPLDNLLNQAQQDLVRR